MNLLYDAVHAAPCDGATVRVGLYVIDHHVGPFLGQTNGYGPTDAVLSSGAGDEGNLTFQVVHFRSYQWQ